MNNKVKEFEILTGYTKRNTESFKEEVYELVGDEYLVLGEYKNSHSKLLMKHDKCGCEWYMVS